MHLVLLRRPHGGQAVDLVEEDDGRSPLGGLVKERPELPLGLADPLGQDVAALPHEERDLAPSRAGRRGGQGPGDERLARARGPVEEDAAWGFGPQAGEELMVREREEDLSFFFRFFFF